MQFLVIQICPPCRKGTSQLLISYTHTRTQKLSMFVFTLLNALSYFHFLFQVQIKTWFLYTSRSSFEISKQTCMYSYTNILSTLLLTYILQCKNKEYSSFVIISCKVYLKVMNNVCRDTHFILLIYICIDMGLSLFNNRNIAPIILLVKYDRQRFVW